MYIVIVALHRVEKFPSCDVIWPWRWPRCVRSEYAIPTPDINGDASHMVNGLGHNRFLTPEGVETVTLDSPPLAPLTPKPLTPRRRKPPRADVMWLFNASNTTLVLLTMTCMTSPFLCQHPLTCKLLHS